MKIHLRRKKLKGRESLSIEYYNGTITDEHGKQKHDRKYEHLELYLILDPKTTKEKKQNKETLETAEQILAIRKAEYFQGKFNIKSSHKSKRSFLDYYNQLKEDRYDSKGNYDNWDAAQKHISRYCTLTLTFDNVDEKFAKGFRKYLDKDALTKSGTPLSQNSKYTYFNKFKAAIRNAYEEGYIDTNILKGVKSFAMAESTREYLTYKELQSLTNAECKYPILKNAFIFSCLTGVRWSDVDKMTWSEVRDEDETSRIIFKQKKTDGLEYLYISDQARKLLGERRDKTNKVFKGLKYGAHFNAEILRWCMRAGITKHITFHSARHSNAVLLLENGADIYTVSKRLGHKELRTTEIYAKIIDSKMKEAANLIPELSI